MATLVKKRKKYYIRIYLPGGREKYISTGTGNLREAGRHLKLIQDKEFLFKASLIAEAELENLDLLTAKYRFLEDRKQNGRRPKTILSYDLSIDNLIQATSPSLQVSNLGKQHLHKMITMLQNRAFKDSTINIRIRSVNAFTRWLLEKEYILNPVKISQIKLDERLPKFLTPEELDRIYSQIKEPKMLATFKVYEGLGLRLRELHHCNLDGNYVVVPAEYSKSRRDRMIPISESLVHDFKIATTSPYQPDSITHAFRRYADRAGIAPEKTLHSMRHTYALRKLVETNNIVFVKELLGHRDIETTMIYTRFPMDYLMKLLDTPPSVKIDLIAAGEA